MKILVVDDSLIIRKKMKEILESLGYKVVFAEDGEEALVQYRKEKPAVVTMDLDMPKMDGISALKYIISMDHNAKVIISTSSGVSQSVLEAIKNGALGYVLKPPTKIGLETAIQKATEKFPNKL